MGSRLGRYKVLKHLASGGMADLLLARADGSGGFERHVVLKRIRSEHARDQRFIDMFLDEARLAANLHHQNVVQVHDIGESDGEYFFAMEYIHGEDLRELLTRVAKARTHMPLGNVCSIISSVAAGLHYAHERRGTDKKPLNIVHRDVSPANILVGYDGSVKIVDFGIAKAARQVETRSGSLKGKVSYMSPEQCKNVSVDRRSDIYALGVVLYELATTTRLFKSDSDYLVMDAICTGKIPQPRVRRADLPPELSAIIMTALATERERRYQTAEELRVALDQFALKAGLTASAGTLASYIHKMFGERPEPWLDNAVVEPRGPGHEDTMPGVEAQAAGRSWTEIPRDQIARAATVAEATGPGGPGGRISTVSATIPIPIPEREHSGAAAVPQVAIVESSTKTNTEVGWEHTGQVRAPGKGLTRAQAAKIIVPLLAVLGVLLWKLLGSPTTTVQPPAVPTATAAVRAPANAEKRERPNDHTVARPAAQTTTTAPAPAMVPAPATMPAPATVPAKATVPAPAPGRGAGSAVEPVPRGSVAVQSSGAPAIAGTAPAIASRPPPSAGSTTRPAPAPRPAITGTSGATRASPTTPTAASAPASIAATPPPSVRAAPIEPAPSEPVKPAVASPPAPPPVAAMAQVAPSVVAQLASRDRKALLKCEGSETLSGDLAIKFEINAEGHVVKSQLDSTLKKPAVAACILATVRSWRFPKPATGAAAGVYEVSFQ